VASGRRSCTGAGCLIVTFPLWIEVAVAAVFTLVAPVLVPLVALTHPAQFAPYAAQWAGFVAFAPLVAALCVRNPKAVRALPRGPDGRVAGPVRRALLVRRLRQILLVLTLPGAAALLALLPGADELTAAMNGDASAQRTAMFVLLRMFLAAVACLAAVIAGCRWWDRTFTPVREVVTEQMVQGALAEARAGLRALDKHRTEVDRMIRCLQARQAAAGSEREFHQMRQLHRESHQCGTVQREYFQTVLSRCHTMRWLVAGTRTSAAPRLIPLRDPHTGRRQRLDAAARAGILAAGRELAEVRQTMEQRADSTLLRVNHLNMGTARLRDQIRDECGPRGWNWYQERAGARLGEPA
jgi:hypothetical protein